jgi:hypothetical protein
MQIMKEINEAYEVLCDDTKRADYDEQYYDMDFKNQTWTYERTNTNAGVQREAGEWSEREAEERYEEQCYNHQNLYNDYNDYVIDRETPHESSSRQSELKNIFKTLIVSIIVGVILVNIVQGCPTRKKPDRTPPPSVEYVLPKSEGTFSGSSNSLYRTPNTTPDTSRNQTRVIHQYANIGKGIAKQIYSRTVYDYDYKAQMVGNKIGRAPQESPEPYQKKICTGYAIEFFVLFNNEMKKIGLYNDKKAKAMIYNEPNHWRNLIVDNIHKQAYLIEPQDGNIETIEYDSLLTKPDDLYYHGSVTVIGRM